MHTFTALLERFEEKGEKTGRATLGWTYFIVPLNVTEALRPGQRTSFRVRGTLDALGIRHVALIPMGAEYNGAFLLPVNADMRRGIRKEAGQRVHVALEFEDEPMPFSADLLACLDDDPAAKAFFATLAKGHQQYFSNWIDDAKTPATRAKRLMQAITGLSRGMGYGEMIRYFKAKRE